MGIESDQLVYDYLSRVGDIAQRQAELTSADRMRLVSRLRTEIERRRASEGAETPAAVQRILTGLGTPDEAVAAAGGRTDAGGRVPAPRREGEPARAAAPSGPPSYAMPERPTADVTAGAAETAPGAGDAPDWWSVDAASSPLASPFAGTGTAQSTIHGFTGGIEIPDILKPPPRPRDDRDEPEEAAVRQGEHGSEGTWDEEDDADGPRRPSLFRRADGAPVPPLLLLVALILVVGAVLSNWIVLAAGWGLAYLTRKLSQTESKWAVMGVPGLVAAAGIVWLWGRTEGRWGAPVPDGGLGAAMSDTWPWVLRAAAVASAAFVVWRSRRPG
ncbi:hypothetical protein IPZ58_20620 [Streptomyces roseoverticillatus]|uniref:hypothetical protein n=1 Tax=Streptomyces roseoverticillatus TaxID=66429 RepID=UPI001F271C53|nr:hypothetical protein [Streptomyces roseoverticillatus]MCF3103976.1 hypothetical protein [Streptomyces roseoverticillatus]